MVHETKEEKMSITSHMVGYNEDAARFKVLLSSPSSHLPSSPRGACRCSYRRKHSAGDGYHVEDPSVA
jgi:hypothetical protein